LGERLIFIYCFIIANFFRVYG